MGLFTIFRIFTLAILFNLCLPTGDIYSDIGLMVQTIKFKNSDTYEMLGCRACYGKEEAEMKRIKFRLVDRGRPGGTDVHTLKCQ